MKLRNLRIYTLPDGREFIADTLYTKGYGLYSTKNWERLGPAEFLIDTCGRLLRNGEPTGWNISQLKDTGRSSRYPAVTRLL